MEGPFVTMNDMNGLGNLGEMRTYVKLTNPATGQTITGWEEEAWEKAFDKGGEWKLTSSEEREYESIGSKIGTGFMNLFSQYVETQTQPDYSSPTPALRPAPKKTGANIAIIAGIAAVLGIGAWMFMKK